MLRTRGLTRTRGGTDSTEIERKYPIIMSAHSFCQKNAKELKRIFAVMLQECVSSLGVSKDALGPPARQKVLLEDFGVFVYDIFHDDGIDYDEDPDEEGSFEPDEEEEEEDGYSYEEEEDEE